MGLLSSIHAQEEVKPIKKTVEKSDTVKVKVWQGFFVEFDVAPLIESALINKYAYTYQGNLMINLSNRFFPMIEMGYAGADKTNINEISFKPAVCFKNRDRFQTAKTASISTIKHNFVLGGLRFGIATSTILLTTH